MTRSNLMRVSPEFEKMALRLKEGLRLRLNREPTDAEITREIAKLIEKPLINTYDPVYIERRRRTKSIWSMGP